MKLVTYSATRRGAATIGIIAADGSIIDLATTAKKARVKLSFAADDMKKKDEAKKEAKKDDKKK